MRKTRLNSLLYLALVGLALAVPGRAVHAGDPHDIFVRTGVVTGVFNGKDLGKGSFSTNINAEGELWLYRNPREAWIFRALLANESDIGRTRYFGAGTGQRFFIYSDGTIIAQQIGNDTIRIRPHLAIYAGWDASMGQFLVTPFGPVLAAYATTVDVGGCVGVRKSVTSELSVDMMVGYTYSSSVLSPSSVTASNVRALVGVGMTFLERFLGE